MDAMNDSTFPDRTPAIQAVTTATHTLARPPRQVLGKGSIQLDTSADSANTRLTTVTEQHLGASRTYRRAASASRRRPTTFARLELREGVVLSVEADAFRARLVDPEDVDPDEELDIDLDQISRGDLSLIKPGALFFWAIGYLTKPTGRRELVLKIEFRRLAKARPDAPERANEAALTYMKDAGWS